MAADGGQGHGGGDYRRLEGMEKVATLRSTRLEEQRAMATGDVVGLANQRHWSCDEEGDRIASASAEHVLADAILRSPRSKGLAASMLR